ncbi:succinate--CoA ligase [GDP-forming] subunit beta, mitochondrial [Nilaparvata lugens]|uniref:succinate--CoA ligase [GDP-forming] subunit beta, mitochondrial n=1 Tax=Nilaparvata lugens TaxID=108931 RepID=UPI00193E778D|nr:succinate--CoA ligase [GDP-forming] subunit beta, mitochondrial [Nilaparvata lugens]XP_039298689.1 succinate--CoA ligase [GDP-forming] subunit beta, mitochondrial [Nilaparvata lugens]
MDRLGRAVLQSTNFLKLQNKNLRQPVRYLNLLECDSKSLLKKYGVCVQDFRIVEKPEDLAGIKREFKVNEYVVKAQILAGGRGLGVFDNKFKGGVHLTKKPEKLDDMVHNMLLHRLITKQTPKNGILVKKLMIAESVDIKRETYFCLLLDRQHNGPVIIASPAGGTDIEDVAKKTPELIKTFPIDIMEGLTDKTADQVATFLGFKGDFHSKAVAELKYLWDFFLKVDATQLEINPLVETEANTVVSVDAKIQFDDNAAFRQKDIFQLHETGEMDPRENEAQKHNLNYVGLDGNIGCLVNGAGLAMATMDIIKLHGGEPANFLDVGGGVTEDQVLHAFTILTSDSNVKSILVNVFGGIVNCAIIAQGIINASKTIKLKVPLTVRLEGTNVSEGRRLLEQSGLPIKFAPDLEEAAKSAVSSLSRT